MLFQVLDVIPPAAMPLVAPLGDWNKGQLHPAIFKNHLLVFRKKMPTLMSCTALVSQETPTLRIHTRSIRTNFWTVQSNTIKIVFSRLETIDQISCTPQEPFAFKTKRLYIPAAPFV